MTKLQCPPASFFRRVGAYVYDALLAGSIFMLAGGVGTGVTAALNAMGLIDLSGYQDVAAYLNDNLLYQIWALGWFCAFYLWFWTRNGQTLGMRAWRLKLVNKQGEPITFTQACVRLVTATLGLANLVMLFDPLDRQGLQDHMAGTRLIQLPKEANK